MLMNQLTATEKFGMGKPATDLVNDKMHCNKPVMGNEKLIIGLTKVVTLQPTTSCAHHVFILFFAERSQMQKQKWTNMENIINLRNRNYSIFSHLFYFGSFVKYNM